MSEPFIRLEGVSKTYETLGDDIFAVDAVSLEQSRGEFVSLLGPSGCGKSTLLLMAAGLITHDSGRITIDGTRVERPYTDLGIVFQEANLLDWRNVLKNLMIQAEIRRLDRQVYEERAMDLLEMVGLEGYEKRYPFELSGGMQRAFQFAARFSTIRLSF